MPVRRKVTLLFAVAMAAVLAAAGAFLYLRLRDDLRTGTDDALRARADTLVSALREAELSDAGLLIEGEEAFAQVLGPGGGVERASPSVGERPLLPGDEATGLGRPTFSDVTRAAEGEVEPARILAVPLEAGRVLVVGTSTEAQRDALGTLLGVLLVGGPVALALSGVAVWLLTGTALRPVDRMRAEAEALSISETGRRLPVPGTRDEVARLGLSLNRMLDRMERALLRERRFVDDASHELRTPVAALKGELDLALRRSRSPEELEATLRRASVAADSLARLAEDLLVLARAEDGRLPVRREEVGLPETVGQILADHAGSGRMDVRVEGSATLDPLRLRQVLTNLVDNALRYSGEDGRVFVRSSRDGDGALLLEVEDTGPGFPDEVLGRPFEPFVRGARARAHADGGAGLGLAIVGTVMASHGGAAELQNVRGGGALVRLRFPGA